MPSGNRGVPVSTGKNIAQRKPRYVFFSFSAADRSTALTLKDHLTGIGLDVAMSLSPDKPYLVMARQAMVVSDETITAAEAKFQALAEELGVEYDG